MAKESVLIIEDNLGASVLLKSVIKQAGFDFDFTVSESSSEALNILKKANEDQPGLIFLDLNLPIKNGWYFLEKLEELGIHLKSKIIVLTTSINQDDLLRARTYDQIVGYFNKPITFKKIKRILTQLYDTIE